MRSDDIGVFYLETSDMGGEIVPVINALQAGTTLLFQQRERQTYLWRNDSERDAQLGHGEGATAYQLDTKTEYKFENGAWRLATPHIEFNLKRSLGDAASFEPIHQGLAPESQAYTSSREFVKDLGDGFFRIVDPGLYSLSMVTRINGSASVGISELVIARANANKSYAGIVATGSITNERTYGSVSVPNLRLITANNDFGFAMSKRTGGDHEVESTCRITRIG